MTSSTGPPLPPWLTTRPPVSFFPGLRDLDIRPRVPFTLAEDTTKLPSTSTPSAVETLSTDTDRVVTVTDVVVEEDEEISDVTTTEKTADVVKNIEIERRNQEEEEARMEKAREQMERRRKEEEQRRVEEEEREEERKRLAYSSFTKEEEEVRVHISTLAPSPSVAPHMDTISPLSMCPPRNIRALSWSWSRPGSTASLACPPGTTGSASWTCSSSTSTESGTPQWATPSPDLSDCQSLWMTKIIRELRKSELILGLASDLMQYVSANPLYGGDVKSAVNAMTIITEKMQYQLEKVPTLEQREAMVMELAQATVKTASSLLSPENLPAWQDLPTSQRSKFVSHLVSTLERAGSLLPASLPPDREASVSSSNVLLTVRRISFRNIHRTHLPSVASLATPAWRDYSDSVEVPALVLMENMQAEGAMLVFLSLKHMEELAGAPGGQLVTSQVVHLSLGGGQIVREPLAITLEHGSRRGETRCVLWEPESQKWNPDFCSTVESNLTHTTCHCSRLGTFALLQEQRQPGDEVARMNFLVTVIIAISVSIVFFVSIILAFIYCYRMKAHQQLKLRLGRTDLSCLRQQKPWSLSDSPTITEDLFHAREDQGQNVHNCGLLTLNSTSLVRGGPYTSSPTHATCPAPTFRPQAPQPPGPAPLFGVASQSSSNQHIYMEVDPLYCTHTTGPIVGEVQRCSEGVVHSSESSQSSSGYSSGPSSDGGKLLVQGTETTLGATTLAALQQQHLNNLQRGDNGGYTIYRVGGPAQDFRGHSVTLGHTRRQLF